jgi:hypothetical protein
MGFTPAGAIGQLEDIGWMNECLSQRNQPGRIWFQKL